MFGHISNASHATETGPKYIKSRQGENCGLELIYGAFLKACIALVCRDVGNYRVLFFCFYISGRLDLWFREAQKQALQQHPHIPTHVDIRIPITSYTISCLSYTPTFLLLPCRPPLAALQGHQARGCRLQQAAFQPPEPRPPPTNPWR